MQLHRNPLPPISRRDALHRIGAGLGSVGLAGMFNQSTSAGQASPLAPKAPHFAPKAKHVIQLFMPGGPSQVDTFDYKPKIAEFAGKRPRDCRSKVAPEHQERPVSVALRFQAIWADR